MPREKDYIQQLSVYIQKNLSKGYTLESLKYALLNQDYSRSAVERAIKLANQELAKKLPPVKEKPVITYEIVDAPDEIQMPKKQNFFKRLINSFFG